MLEGSFECSSEFHLSTLKSKYSPLIYSLGLRLSKTSGKLFCSAINLAEYFACHRNTIYKSLSELTDSGFFVVLEKQKFDTTVYRVLAHDEWAESHPNECATKKQSPYSVEKDSLGQQLFAISGGKVKPFPHHIKILRETGFSENKIVNFFKEYAEKSANPTKIAYFIAFLQRMQNTISKLRMASGPAVIPKTNESHTPYGGYETTP